MAESEASPDTKSEVTSECDLETHSIEVLDHTDGVSIMAAPDTKSEVPSEYGLESHSIEVLDHTVGVSIMAEGGAAPDTKSEVPSECVLEPHSIEVLDHTVGVSIKAEGKASPDTKSEVTLECDIEPHCTQVFDQTADVSTMGKGEALVEAKPEVPSECDSMSQHVHIFDSLELLFSRDILVYVIRSQMPRWHFWMLYGAVCPCTPFSFRIRRAVDFYLTKESLALYMLFTSCAMGEHMDYDGYVRGFNFVVDSHPDLVDSIEVLHVVSLCSLYTARACRLGVEMAPYFAVTRLQEVLRDFIRRTNTTADKFFAHLGYEAENVIRQESTWQLMESK